jgi:UDP-glucose:(glucosyl)LPS alpha-1,2-glucosyltransferase
VPNLDLMEVNELSRNSNGGTEYIQKRLYDGELPRELLEKFQIFFSRVRNPDPNKKKILFCHDLPSDPESALIANGGWNNFEKIVFVSNWQMTQYIQYFGIPWYKCKVMRNAIDPIKTEEKPLDKIRIIYHTTPHRGLSLLLSSFLKLAEQWDDIELDVFSSFDIYGWGERDKHFEPLFKLCKEHPQINYHGYQPNFVIRDYIGTKSHIFAYPSIWLETSCIALLEALSGELWCVYPNYGALPETGANWGFDYQWIEDPRDHLDSFTLELAKSIATLRSYRENDKGRQDYTTRQNLQKIYFDNFYSWNNRIPEWERFLRSLI